MSVRDNGVDSSYICFPAFATGSARPGCLAVGQHHLGREEDLAALVPGDEDRLALRGRCKDGLVFVLRQRVGDEDAPFGQLFSPTRPEVTPGSTLPSSLRRSTDRNRRRHH